MKTTLKARPKSLAHPGWIAAAVATLGLLGASAASCQSDDDREVASRHRQVIAGHRVEYESLVGREPIRIAGTDAVRARMFYAGYRIEPAAGHVRPLTVIWNGGPGGSMMSMLVGGQGPKRVEAGRIVDNADTILDATDLLYLDAIGSGFSRPETMADRALFYQTRGDVDAFVECILAWRRRHGAEDQPVYLAGVSWGAYRVAAVAKALADRGVPVGGGAMMAGRNGLARPGAEQRYLPLGIVHYPRIALTHGKLPASPGTDIDAVERDAAVWAPSTYLPALDRIGQLTQAERDTIGARLAMYSGLPAARLDRRTLIVTPRDMVDGLLADRGQRLVRFDLRLVMPAAPRRAPLRSPGERYLRDALGYRTGLAYLGLVWDASRIDGFAPAGFDIPEWNYLDGYYADSLSREEHASRNAAAEAGGYPPGGQEEPLALQAMQRVPTMRMLVVHGRFDALPSSCASVEAQLAKIDPTVRPRVSFLCVDSGHALFTNDAAARSTINGAMRALLAAGLPATQPGGSTAKRSSGRAST